MGFIYQEANAYGVEAFAIPFFKASIFSCPSSSFGTPPLYFNARTVATMTAAASFRQNNLHFSYELPERTFLRCKCT